MPTLLLPPLPLAFIISLEVACIDSGAKRRERGKLVLDAGFGQRSREARFVALDGEAEDVVFVRGDARFGEEEIVG